MRTCPFHGCAKQLPDYMFACKPHWSCLSRTEQALVSAAYELYTLEKIGIDDLRRRQQEVLGDRGFAGQSQSSVASAIEKLEAINPGRIEKVSEFFQKHGPAMLADAEALLQPPAPSPGQIRDLLIRYIELHDATCPDQRDGKPCVERANVLAFLAHSIGFSSSDMLAFKKCLVTYEVHCTNADHAHERTEL